MEHAIGYIQKITSGMKAGKINNSTTAAFFILDSLLLSAFLTKYHVSPLLQIPSCYLHHKAFLWKFMKNVAPCDKYKWSITIQTIELM